MGKGQQKKQKKREEAAAARAASGSDISKTIEDIERDDLEKLCDLENLSTPAKNFLAWQINVRKHPISKGTALNVWCERDDISETCQAFGTKFAALRLTVKVRTVVGGIIGYFFDLFDQNKVPRSRIDVADIRVHRNLVVSVPGVLVEELSDTSKTRAIDNLVSVLSAVVGQIVPHDVHHLITYALKQAKVSPHMKHVVLRHPSIYLECTMSSYVCYLYRMVKYSMYNDKSSWKLFRDIANASVPPQFDWEKRVQSAGPEWSQFLFDTRAAIGGQGGSKELKHFHEPIGLLCFMRHTIIHYRRSDIGATKRAPRDVESDLHALFPLFMSHFICFMIENGYFQGFWMN